MLFDSYLLGGLGVTPGGDSRPISAKELIAVVKSRLESLKNIGRDDPRFKQAQRDIRHYQERLAYLEEHNSDGRVLCILCKKPLTRAWAKNNPLSSCCEHCTNNSTCVKKRR